MTVKEFFDVFYYMGMVLTFPIGFIAISTDDIYFALLFGFLFNCFIYGHDCLLKVGLKTRNGKREEIKRW